MIDAFEQKHGPVADRSIFDGEIVVPPHLRNLSLTSIRANRLHGSLFGNATRSRTFLNLSQNERHTIHGSVPDLTRNSNPFTLSHSNSINTDTMLTMDGTDGNGRRMSSASACTKIILNTSTTLTLTDESSGYLSNGNISQYSNDKQMYSHIGSIDEYCHNIRATNDGHNKSDSIRSLNDIQLRDTIMHDDQCAAFCQSLGRPNRLQKPTTKFANNNNNHNINNNNNSNGKYARASSSMAAYNAEGYMTMIKTNLAPSTHSTYHHSSHNRAISPTRNAQSMHEINAIANNSQMASSTSTFQRKVAAPQPPRPLPKPLPSQPQLLPKAQLQSQSQSMPPPPPHKINHFNQLNRGGVGSSNGGRAAPTDELSLNNLAKFKLPRVSLNHSTVTNPQQ